MDNIQPGQQIGTYQVVAQVGQGGMASVYKAYQASMDRYVALKILPREFAHSAEFRARFQQEARLIANLEHASILPIYDFGESDGIHYFVMRLLEAGTLKQRIRAKPLTLTEIDEIFTQIADALGYAHQRGIIHRDIKPSNVLIDSHGDAFLTDFGIAKIIEGTSGLTGTGTVTGTPDYMSPEQGLGQKLDLRSDIYSLGVVLYEMVTGRVPFEAETPLAVILKHMNSPLPPPSQVKTDVSPHVERVILKALAKDRAERFATCTEFITTWKAAVKAVETEPATVSVSTPVTSSITYPATISQQIPDVDTSAAPPPVPTFTSSTSSYPQTPIAPPNPANNWMLFAVLALIGVCLCLVLVGGAGSVPFIAAALQGNSAVTLTSVGTIATVPPIGTVDVEFPTPEPFPTVEGLPTSEAIPTVAPLDTPVPEGALASVLWSVGNEGGGPGEFDDARYMAVDGAGNIYIGEHQQGSRIQIFDADGNVVNEWKIDTEAYLIGLSAKSDGTLYAIMTRDIYVYEGATGELLDTISLSDSVNMLTVSKNDEVYAITNYDIVKFDDAGQPVTVVSNFGEMFDEALSPSDMAVDEAGNIYVVGSGVENILKFSPDGSSLSRIGESGSAAGQLLISPEAIAIDSQGRIYASGFSGIQVFDAEGSYLGNIPLDGLAFSIIAVDNDGTTELIVLDRNAAKLIKYEVGE